MKAGVVAGQRGSRGDMKGLRRFSPFSGVLATALISGMVLLAPQSSATPGFTDDLTQRVRACTACHGIQDRVTADGYFPRIAGKPSGYIYNQLVNFREGRRSYRLMGPMLDPLSDTYLREIADHFGALTWPDAALPFVAATAWELRRGEQLARQGDASRQVPACIQCHGATLTGVLPGIPGLVGLPRDYLNAQLGAWRTGLRSAHTPDCMAVIARRLSPEDIAAVSGWLARQPQPADPKPAKALPAFLPMRCGSAGLGLPGPRERP